MRPNLNRLLVPALVGAIMVIAIGALGIAFRQPLLFPSLGPTIFIQVDTPNARAARPWNTLMGHALGLGAAIVALLVIGAVHSPTLSWRRYVASAAGIGLMTLGHSLFKASHPPGAATTLLVTPGAITLSLTSVAVIAAGVVITVVLERAFRPLLLRTCHP